MLFVIALMTLKLSVFLSWSNLVSDLDMTQVTMFINISKYKVERWGQLQWRSISLSIFIVDLNVVMKAES